MTDLRPTAPPPGWYPDPARLAEHRWWDGHRWTDGVASRGAIGWVPLPAQPAVSTWPPGAPPPPPPVLVPPAPLPPRPPDQRLDLPAAAAAWALVGALLGVASGVAVSLALDAWTDNLVIVLAGSQAFLWAGMLGAVVGCSRRYGTGDLRRDYQLRFRWLDVALGLGFCFAARLAGAAAIVVVVIARGTSDGLGAEDQFGGFDESRAALYLALAFAVFGAPLIEELFFRGLLMRALEPSLGRAGAVVAQAITFGLVHLSVEATALQNTVTVLAIGIGGLTFGLLVQQCRRLFPSVAAHFWFNVIAAIAILATY